MKHTEKVMPLAALAAAFSTIACCMPLGIAAAVGSAELSAFSGALRPWMVGFSLVSLVFGLAQMYWLKGACQRRSRTSVVLFWTSVVVVAIVTLFPQAVAAILADLGS